MIIRHLPRWNTITMLIYIFLFFNKTIQQRKLKAYSYLSEIKALVNYFPFGKRRLEIGLMLRNAMFINGILFNSEAWHNISKRHIEDLEIIDHILMRFLIGAHSKTPTEALYLETNISITIFLYIFKYKYIHITLVWYGSIGFLC